MNEPDAPSTPDEATPPPEGSGTTATVVGEVVNRASAQKRVRPARGLPSGVVVLIGLAAAVIAIAGMRAIPDIIGPTFLALTLAITVYPLQRRMATKMPRWAAMVLALLLVYVILLGFLVSLVWALAQLATEAGSYKDQMNGLWQQATQLLSRVGVSQQQIQDQLTSISPGSVLGVAQQLLGSVSAVFSQFLFVLTVAIFLAADSMEIEKRLEMMEETHPSLVAGLRKFSKGVRSYWWVTTVFGLIVAVFNVVSLWFIGVPLIITWGVLSFLTNYIPNVGFVIGMVPPAVMALLVAGPLEAVLVVASYCVFNFVIQSVIQPRFTGESVGVNTTMAFLSLMFWSYVIGPLGALLALPLTLLVKNLFLDIEPGSRWLNFLIASDPSSKVAVGTDIDDALHENKTRREPLSERNKAPKPSKRRAEPAQGRAASRKD